MAPPSRRPRSPPALMEELVEEIFLRIPPDEPAHLFRATLICKPWRRILSNPGFLRRYRALHRTPPLLGYFYNVHDNIRGPFPPIRFHQRSFSRVLAVDARQQQTQLAAARARLSPWPRADQGHVRRAYIVWDPITGDQKKLSLPKFQHTYVTGAVLCAVDGCDHLDCHAGAFLVVYCGTEQVDYEHKAWVPMYSSETRVWSSMISIDADYYVDPRPSLIIGNALYFSVQYGVSLLKFNLCGHGLSIIDSPGVMGSVAMELDDGGLGFVAVLDHCIYMWSWLADANNGIGRWEQHMVMELEALLPASDMKRSEVIGLIEGTYTIFISDAAGVFTLDIKSGKVDKVGKREDCYDRILPYMSFYTPSY